MDEVNTGMVATVIWESERGRNRGSRESAVLGFASRLGFVASSSEDVISMTSSSNTAAVADFGFGDSFFDFDLPFEVVFMFELLGGDLDLVLMRSGGVSLLGRERILARSAKERFKSPPSPPSREGLPNIDGPATFKLDAFTMLLEASAAAATVGRLIGRGLGRALGGATEDDDVSILEKEEMLDWSMDLEAAESATAGTRVGIEEKSKMADASVGLGRISVMAV